MDEIRNLIELSILGKKIVQPFKQSIAKEYTGLTFFDRVPRTLPDGKIYAVACVYDKAEAFNYEGKSIDTPWFLEKLVETVGKLNDKVVVIGYFNGPPLGEFVAVDAYQSYGFGARATSGWLSPTYAPAYFKWVLGVECPLRYMVFRNGLKDFSYKQIIKHTGAGMVIVRQQVKGIYENDSRVVHVIDGLNGYEKDGLAND